MKLLILDLDETLIYATEETLEREADFCFEQYRIYKCPFVTDCLSFARQYFLVGVWTSASADYAKAIAQALFPSDYSLQFLWSREHCTQAYHPDLMEYYYIKNLAKLKRKGYDLEKILMVDNTPAKLKRNYGNLIHVADWTGDQSDTELIILQQYLLDLKDEPNVRKLEKRGWQHRYTL